MQHIILKCFMSCVPLIAAQNTYQSGISFGKGRKHCEISAKYLYFLFFSLKPLFILFFKIVKYGLFDKFQVSFINNPEGHIPMWHTITLMAKVNNV